MFNEQLLTPCGEGLAVENRAADTTSLKVYPMTSNGYLSGELSDVAQKLVASGVDASGHSYTDTVSIGVFIIAKWYRGSAETAEPPWVRKGERIKLFRIGDSLEYYWQSLSLDTGLRRQETKTFLAGAVTDESVKDINPDNAYAIQMSGHDKRITIQTSKAQGEPTQLMMNLDGAGGSISIGNSDGEHLHIAKDGSVISLENSVGTGIRIAGDTITFTCRVYKIESEFVDIKTRYMATTAQTWTLSGASAYMVTSNRISLMGALTNNNVNISSTHRHQTPSGMSSGPQ